jgi:hypothetical protein
MGFPLVTSITSIFYHLWILLPYAGSLMICIYVRDYPLIMRYFLAYFLCWTILGMGLAIWFASVGPCFAAPMIGNHTFDAQMAYLRAADTQFPVLVLPVQDALIAWFRSGSGELGRGISAMPSMHISVAVLLFLAMRHISKIAAVMAGCFAGIIFLGSVHLAYHYAVDGYVAAIGTLLIWKLAGWIAPRLTRNLPAPPN